MQQFKTNSSTNAQTPRSAAVLNTYQEKVVNTAQRVLQNRGSIPTTPALVTPVRPTGNVTTPEEQQMPPTPGASVISLTPSTVMETPGQQSARRAQTPEKILDKYRTRNAEYVRSTFSHMASSHDPHILDRLQLCNTSLLKFSGVPKRNFTILNRQGTTASYPIAKLCKDLYVKKQLMDNEEVFQSANVSNVLGLHVDNYAPKLIRKGKERNEKGAVTVFTQSISAIMTPMTPMAGIKVKKSETSNLTDNVHF